MRCRFIRKMRGPEGRRLNVSPARKGWVIESMDPSAVGAALKHAASRTSKLLIDLRPIEREPHLKTGGMRD